jgi:hypothetical protein
MNQELREQAIKDVWEMRLKHPVDALSVIYKDIAVEQRTLVLELQRDKAQMRKDTLAEVAKYLCKCRNNAGSCYTCRNLRTMQELATIDQEKANG